MPDTLSNESLQPVLLQSLWVDPLQHPRGQAHLSAASGLVQLHGRFYVVADDELHLGVFADNAAPGVPSTPGTLLRLLDGDLPDGKRERKQAKPDLEVLTLLPPMPACPSGAMLALGSGSRPNRETGVLMALDASGAPNGRMAALNLTALYAPLRKRFADLNIEGALVVSGELMLLQRGNKGDARSACIRYDWNQIAPWLAGLTTQPPHAKSVQVLQLGSVGGAPLSLTDGTALHGGEWMFCAVAEDTADSVQDGACLGSAIGIVGTDGQVRRVLPLAGAPKVEGISAQATGDCWMVTLVTDPDDPAQTSQMLRVRLPMLIA
ncbi:MAG: hypothetical protein H7Y28_06035 [Rhodoferax sp.]|nr:hypothetical protein [Rhodoferax sp.]